MSSKDVKKKDNCHCQIQIPCIPEASDMDIQNL